MVPNYIYFHIPELNCFYLQAASRNVQLKGGSDITFDENQGIYLGRIHGYELAAKKNLGM